MEFINWESFHVTYQNTQNKHTKCLILSTQLLKIILVKFSSIPGYNLFKKLWWKSALFMAKISLYLKSIAIFLIGKLY